jgi:hypothetical protein
MLSIKTKYNLKVRTFIARQEEKAPIQIDTVVIVKEEQG